MNKINQEEYNQINNILCNEKELENLKKMDLQIPEIEIKHHKWEKKIQDIMKVYFEYNLNIEIIEEEFKNIPQLQQHNYLLIDDLKNAIESLNEDIFNEYSHISKKNIIKIILEDFIYRFDNSKNNVEKHNLYFDLKSKTIQLKDNEGSQKIVYYKVLDLNKYSSINNKIRIIKEKKILDKGILKESEFPDFAYYVNGLPFIAIEVKTPEAGIKAATNDYYNKKTYHKFLACLGTDGDKSFISTNPNYNDMFLWGNYGSKKSNGGLKDISEELLFNKENLLFYFQYATLPVYSKDNPYLKNARVQQYFVLKFYKSYFNKLLIKKLNNKKISFKNYFKHHTRTGKSFTFKLILNLLGNGSNNNGDKYHKLYRKIYIFTHDLTVKRNLTIEFSNHQFGEYTGLKTIDSRNEYIDSIYDTYEIKDIKINKELNGKNIYLLNIQKTELPKKDISEILTENFGVSENILNKKLTKRKVKKENVYKGDDVLFLIDEIHTHQNMESGYGYVRDETFPNASYITATATPAIIEKEDELINMTKEYFGEEIDNFSPSDAIKLEIVVPLLYEKYLWTMKDSDNDSLKDLKLRISKLDEIAKQMATLKILGGEYNKDNIEIQEEGQIENIIESLSTDYQIRTIFKNIDKNEIISNLIEILVFDLFIEMDNKQNEIIKTDEKHYKKFGFDNINLIIKKFEELKKEKILYLYKRQKEELMYQLNRDLIPFKLNLITQDVLFLREQTSFKPKFFWVVDDVKTAVSIITFIKSVTDSKQNIINNVRFGIDVSSIKLENLDKEDKNFLEENETKWKDINGDYLVKSSNTKHKSDAITDFESDKEGTIDVLVIVGKYLMGYDLDKLLKVYLDTKIKDIKKIIQVATRGSTKKENKEQSFILDLTLDNETKGVYERALSIYDDIDGIDSFSIDENTIQTCLANLETSFTNILNFFKIKNKELINEKIDIQDFSKDMKSKNDFFKNKFNMIETLIEISNYKIKINKNDKIENDTYWKEIKEINKILKALISPKYFINGKVNLFKYIECIMEINTIYFSKILYKDSKDSFSFSNEEIKKMIKDTFGILSLEFGETFNKINDILKLEDTKVDNIHKIDSKTKVEIKSSLYRISEQLKTPPLSKDIADQIFSLIDEIDNNKDILANYKKVQELTEKEFKQIIRTIENDYEDNLVFYIVDNYLKEYNNKLIKEDNKFNNIIKQFSKKYSQKINDLIEEGSIDNKEEEEKINIIIDNLKLSNINEVIKNLTKEEMSLLLNNDYKKDYIDKEDYKIVFTQIMIEVFNKELIYEYYFNKDK